MLITIISALLAVNLPKEPVKQEVFKQSICITNDRQQFYDIGKKKRK